MNTFILIAVFLIIFYAIHQLNEKLFKIHTFGKEHSLQFRISAVEALENNEFFRTSTGIKSYAERIPLDKWAETEKELLDKKWREIIESSTFVILTYIASDDSFLVQQKKGTYMVLNDDTNKILYSAFVVGDTFNRDNLEFIIKRRFVTINKKREDVITAYFKRSYGLTGKEPEAILLFDFPFATWNDEILKTNGFEVKYEGGDDVWTDELGDSTSALSWISIKKNGAEISI